MDSVVSYMGVDETDKEPIYVFELEDTYLFRHYFAREDIFAELSEYYNGEEYRFEIPTDEFPEVQDFLERNWYRPVFVDDTESFSVVKEQYTEHAEILKRAVMHWTRDGYHFFILQDPQAVEIAVEQGATRLTEMDLVLGV